MKDMTFYLEFKTPKEKRKANKHNNYKGHSGNCLAVFGPYFRSSQKWCKECISAYFDYANSPVGLSSACNEYIAENCKRVSEKVAREIHPQLFNYLDYTPEE